MFLMVFFVSQYEVNRLRADLTALTGVVAELRAEMDRRTAAQAALGMQAIGGRREMNESTNRIHDADMSQRDENESEAE
jgi:hypothetical protein